MRRLTVQRMKRHFCSFAVRRLPSASGKALGTAWLAGQALKDVDPLLRWMLQLLCFDHFHSDEENLSGF